MRDHRLSARWTDSIDSLEYAHCVWETRELVSKELSGTEDAIQSYVIPSRLYKAGAKTSHQKTPKSRKVRDIRSI